MLCINSTSWMQGFTTEDTEGTERGLGKQLTSISVFFVSSVVITFSSEHFRKQSVVVAINMTHCWLVLCRKSHSTGSKLPLSRDVPTSRSMWNNCEWWCVLWVVTWTNAAALLVAALWIASE